MKKEITKDYAEGAFQYNAGIGKPFNLAIERVDLLEVNNLNQYRNRERGNKIFINCINIERGELNYGIKRSSSRLQQCQRIRRKV